MIELALCAAVLWLALGVAWHTSAPVRPLARLPFAGGRDERSQDGS